MTQEERIANALAKSVQITVDFYHAASYTWDRDQTWNEDYNNASRAIVEPKGLSQEDEDFYVGWMIDEPEEWSQFILTTLGTDWKRIADLVSVNGY